MANLLPTAIEAVSGFAWATGGDQPATAFVYRKTTEEALFPIAVGQHHPVVASADPGAALGMGFPIVAAIICFFLTLVNMTRGLRDVRPSSSS